MVQQKNITKRDQKKKTKKNQQTAIRFSTQAENKKYFTIVPFFRLFVIELAVKHTIKFNRYGAVIIVSYVFDIRNVIIQP